MGLIDKWTGRTACALQVALRLSNEAFAAHLGVAVRTVAGWHQKPNLTPKSEMQQLLDTALDQAPGDARSRFDALIESTTEPPESSATPEHDPAVLEAKRRLTADQNVRLVLDWLDRQAAWEPGRARQEVATRLERLGWQELHDRGSRRGRVDQPHIVRSLMDYYKDRAEGYGVYCAQYGASFQATTSVLTHGRWLDLQCELTPENDRLELVSGVSDDGVTLDTLSADLAVQRLAEMLAFGFRVVDTRSTGSWTWTFSLARLAAHSAWSRSSGTHSRWICSRAS